MLKRQLLTRRRGDHEEIQKLLYSTDFNIQVLGCFG
jgi:hypothetical protein